MIKLIEGASKEELEDYTSEAHTKILPNIDSNIRNGNSLVGFEYLQYNKNFYDKPDLFPKLRLFDWTEITGRSYGGGVLTFEPGEIRKLMIPMNCVEKLDINKIDCLMRDNKIEEVLSYTDEILLHEGLGLTENETAMLRNVWLKLSGRRLGRKEKQRL